MNLKTDIKSIGLNRVDVFMGFLLASVVLMWQVGCTLVADFSDPKRTDGGGILDADPDGDGSIHDGGILDADPDDDGSIHDGGTEDGDIQPECGDRVCDKEDGESFENCSEDCGVIDISAGENHACAVNYDGTLWCWGNNEKGQLGNDNAGTTSSIPVQVQGDLDGKIVKQVSAGGSHTCAVTESEELYCWGLNGNGQVGVGNEENTHYTPIPLNLTEVHHVSAGGDHTCALVELGTLYCWGNNGNGQLGCGDDCSEQTYNSPQIVNYLSQVQQVAAGQAHTCAINESGVLFCWGNNQAKQAGQSSPEDEYNTPYLVGDLGNDNASQVSAGDKHTCAISNTNKLFCWGSNEYKQLGCDVATNIHTPTQVTQFNSDSEIVSCGTDHTCGVKSGNIFCWGNNDLGQLGTGQVSDQEQEPQELGFPTLVQKLSAGFKFTCMVSDGVPYCWGDNAEGKLGNDGQTGSYNTPQEVSWPPNSEN